MVKSGSIYKNIFLCFFVLLFTHMALYSTPLLFLIYTFIPPVIAYAIYYFGMIPGVMLCSATVIFNFAAALCLPGMNLYASLLTTLSIVIPGAVCGLCICKKCKVCDTIIAVSLSVIIFPLIMLAYMKYAEGYNLANEISDVINVSFLRQFQLLKSIYPEISSVFNGNEKEIFSLMATYVPGLLPCFLILLCILYGLLIFGITEFISKRKMIENSFFIQGLDCIYLPKITSVALIISMLFIFMETDSLTIMAAVNVFVIMIFFYMIQGLSLIEYNLKQKNLNLLMRFFAIAGIIIALMFVSAVIPVLNPVFALSLLGISDSAGDYRKLNMNKDEFNEN